MKILRVIIFIIFFAEGLTKLIGLQFQADLFTKWGYPIWFMYLIGAFELAGAIGLLVPILRIYANIGLIGIIIGAFYTHISHDNTIQMMGLAIITSIILLAHFVLYLSGMGKIK